MKKRKGHIRENIIIELFKATEQSPTFNEAKKFIYTEWLAFLLVLVYYKTFINQIRRLIALAVYWNLDNQRTQNISKAINNQSPVERGNSAPKATGLRMHFLINLIFKTMSKSNSAIDAIISKFEDLEKFAKELPKAKAVKGKKVAKAILTDVSAFDTAKLIELDESIFLSGTNVQLFLQGNVGPYSASLLSRRFKRVGFEGRNIDLSIPTSVSGQDRTALIERISQCVKSDAVDKVKAFVAQGTTISMTAAKEIGLIDQIVDLGKRRGQSKLDTVKVASDGNSASENQTVNS